ncbi:hypothetical protein [Paenibacillus sp. NPDC057967]|uniref:hypothetical protein n=1 Tax=Paenibacillus sp. NPDC057967 TaxID=3346293 RepID=UPI0036DC9964
MNRLQSLMILLALSLIVTLFPQKSDAATQNALLHYSEENRWTYDQRDYMNQSESEAETLEQL